MGSRKGTPKMTPFVRLIAVLALAATGSALAQSYPNRPVKVIVPWPPGQATDVAARAVAEKLSTALGQQFVIDNRAGAGGTMGTEVAAKSTPDGYTILAGSSGPERQRLRVGGPDTFRGAGFGDISGSKVAFSNVEFRFPIFTELLRGLLFVDGATGWRNAGDLKLSTSDGPGGVRLRDLQLAYGFGVRGFVGLPLRIDVGWPTDLVRSAPAFTTFSIGFDY